jgi:hypothetical protein
METNHINTNASAFNLKPPSCSNELDNALSNIYALSSIFQ